MKIWLVISDQYAREVGENTVLSASTPEAAFSTEVKARTFVEAQPNRNQFGPLYWRVKELPVDEEIR